MISRMFWKHVYAAVAKRREYLGGRLVQAWKKIDGSKKLSISVHIRKKIASAQIINSFFVSGRSTKSTNKIGLKTALLEVYLEFYTFLFHYFICLTSKRVDPIEATVVNCHAIDISRILFKDFYTYRVVISWCRRFTAGKCSCSQVYSILFNVHYVQLGYIHYSLWMLQLGERVPAMFTQGFLTRLTSVIE